MTSPFHQHHLSYSKYENKQKNNPTHTIISVYHNPSTPRETFISNLQIAICEILDKHPRTSITIIGDLNIDLLRLSPTNNFYLFMIEYGLYTTIVNHTREDPHHNTRTLIDHIMTTLTHTQMTAGTISPPPSDHLQYMQYSINHYQDKRKTT